MNTKDFAVRYQQKFSTPPAEVEIVQSILHDAAEVYIRTYDETPTQELSSIVCCCFLLAQMHGVDLGEYIDHHLPQATSDGRRQRNERQGSTCSNESLDGN